MIKLKGKYHDKLRKFLSKHIQNEVLTLTCETSYSKGCFDTKLQVKSDKSDQISKQPEEELMDFIEQ